MTEFGRNGRISNNGYEITPKQLIEYELGSNEKVIWAARPVSLIQHAQSATTTAIFGIPFLGFSLFWIWGASEPLREGIDLGITGFEYFFPAFGVPFVLVGLGLILSPVWKAIKASKTIYALTNERLVIMETFPKKSFKSWDIKRIKSLTRTGPPEGPGSLFFAEERVENSHGSYQVKIGFLGIHRPRDIEEKLRSMMISVD